MAAEKSSDHIGVADEELKLEDKMLVDEGLVKRLTVSASKLLFACWL